MIKSTLLAVLLALSANAMAVPIPSNLPDGKYNMECADIRVEKYDPAPPDVAQILIPTDLIHKVEYRTGTIVFTSSGDSVTTTEVYSLHGDNLDAKGEDVTLKELKPLSGNPFEEKNTFSGTRVTPANEYFKESTETKKWSWTRTFKLDGNFEINLNWFDENGVEHSNQWEILVSKNGDGSYTSVSYIRQGYHTNGSNPKEGIRTFAKFVYQVNTTCTYTPIK